jgi:thiamine transport system substrate-binding protein
MIISATLLAACSSTVTTIPASPTTTSRTAAEVVLMTHDSFAISDVLVESFAAETGITIRLLPAGDAGAMVNQAVLTVDNPLADVIFGVDNTLLSRALEGNIFEPYESPSLATAPDELEVDPRVTPIDFGDVCINWDKARLADAGLAPPENLRDLTDPAFRGLLVVEDPGTSSPGLAFLYATIAHFGETGDYTWLDFGPICVTTRCSSPRDGKRRTTRITRRLPTVTARSSSRMHLRRLSK